MRKGKTVLIGLVIFLDCQAYGSDHHAVRGSSLGGARFQVIQISDYRRDQYLIDTQTGRVWSHSCLEAPQDGFCSAPYWPEEPVENLNDGNKVIKSNRKVISQQMESEKIKAPEPIKLKE